MDLEIDIKYNEIYKSAFTDSHRYLHLYGGAGSGKSIFAAQKLLYKLISEKNKRFLLVRKVEKTIRHSQFQLLKKLISDYNINSMFHIRDNTMSIYCYKTKSEILSSGLDDVEKLKSIVDIQTIWIEEATEITRDDFIQLNLRMRGISDTYYQIIFTYNPINEFHWIRHDFHNNERNDTYVLKTTYIDNAFLDDNYKKDVLMALKDTDKTYYSIYTLGEWSSITGLIFTNWDTFETLTDTSYKDYTYGLDFGYNNPTALIKVGIKDNELYVTELLYQSGLTNQELIKSLKELCLEKKIIYCDSAEPQRIEEIKRAGFYSRDANKDVFAGIDFLKRFKIYINSDSYNLIKEFKSYKWRENRDGVKLDEPLKFNDHLIDALRYAVYTHGKKYWVSTNTNTISSIKNTSRYDEFKGF